MFYSHIGLQAAEEKSNHPSHCPDFTSITCRSETFNLWETVSLISIFSFRLTHTLVTLSHTPPSSTPDETSFHNLRFYLTVDTERALPPTYTIIYTFICFKKHWHHLLLIFYNCLPSCWGLCPSHMPLLFYLWWLLFSFLFSTVNIPWQYGITSRDQTIKWASVEREWFSSFLSFLIHYIYHSNPSLAHLFFHNE